MTRSKTDGFGFVQRSVLRILERRKVHGLTTSAIAARVFGERRCTESQRAITSRSLATLARRGLVTKQATLWHAVPEQS